MKSTALACLALFVLAGSAHAQVYRRTGFLPSYTIPPAGSIYFDDIGIPKLLVGANSRIELSSVTVGIFNPSGASTVNLWAAPVLTNNIGAIASVGTPVLLGSAPVAAGAGQIQLTIPTIDPLTNVVELNRSVTGGPNWAWMYIGVEVVQAAGGTNGWLITNAGTNAIGANFNLFFNRLSMSPFTTTGPFVFGGANPPPASFNITVNGTFNTPTTYPIAAGAVAQPNTMNNGSTQNINLRATVSPGQLPLSTGINVVVDANPLGLGFINLLDNGVAPDAVAGDNVFNATMTVPIFTLATTYNLPFIASDVEGGTSAGNIAFAITDAIGACCLAAGTTCSELFLAECIAQGGTFLGNGTTCDTLDTYTAVNSGSAFEDISATGSVFLPDGGTFDDDFMSGVPVGFDFPMYATPYSSLVINTNGFLTFVAGSTANGPVALPNAAAPNEAVYGLLFDIDVTTQGNITFETRGTAGVDRRFIAQWTNVARWSAGGNLGNHTFQIVLFEAGNVELRYGAITPAVNELDFAIGIENVFGTLATSFSSLSLGSGNTSRTLIAVPAGPACTPTPACLGDVNADGVVDGSDFTAFINSFSVGDATIDPLADVNRDGIVDGGDFTAFINAFGAGC